MFWKKSCQNQTKQWLCIAAGLLLLIFWFAPALAQAPVLDTGLDYAKATGLVDTDIRIIIARIINVALGLLGIVALALVIWGGYEYMTAAGDEEQISKAKKILFNAGIGLAIILSAFAITQFVIGKLTDAIMGQYKEDQQPSTCTASDCPFGLQTSFYAVSAPQGKLTIKNVTVSIVFMGNWGFSAEYDKETVPPMKPENIKIVKKSDQISAPGSFNLKTANQIDFNPTGSCLDGDNPVNSDASNICFEKNTTYQVILNTSIKSTNKLFLECSAAHPCVGEFTTGEKMDVTPPVISLNLPGQGALLPVGSNVEVSANYSDDAGVKMVTFNRDGTKIKDEIINPALTQGTISTFWNTGVKVPAIYNLTAIAADVDNHETTSAAQTVKILPLYCFDTVKTENTDEIGADCGPTCGACTGGSCQAALDCANGLTCDAFNICVKQTKITNVEPKDGAIGNYITIWGDNFGVYDAAKSKVKFLGSVAGQEKEGKILSCNSKYTWKDDFIVVEVPAGAQSGPLQVFAATSTPDPFFQDRTDDKIGPYFDPTTVFAVNDKVKPGLGCLKPAQGMPKESVQVEGINFGGTQGTSQLLFGIAPASPVSWSPAFLNTTVPDLPTQNLSVTVKVGGKTGNSLPFKVLEGVKVLPHISGLDPEEGAADSYVTIFGNDFGDNPGKVKFDKDGNKLTADLAECGKAWSDTQIIVKVPSDFKKYNSGKFETTLQVVTQDGESNPVLFNVDNSKPIGPQLCSITPNNGPIDTWVKFNGSFGAKEGKIEYWKSVTSTIYKDGGESWQDKEILDKVEKGAQTGSVKIWSDKLKAYSNPASFKVQNCQEELKKPGAVLEKICGLDNKCCGVGSCVPTAELCPGEVGLKASIYAWSFTTGQIPLVPKVLEECEKNPLSASNPKVPSPSPGWHDKDNFQPPPENVCVNAVVKVRFSTLVKKIDTTNFIVEECSDAVCASPKIVSGNLILSPTDLATFTPASQWAVNTFYRVTLTTDIQSDVPSDKVSANMSPAPEGKCVNPQGKIASYCFSFKTKNDTNLCKLGSAVVSPDPFIAKEFKKIYYPEEDKTLYNVSAIAFDNVCWAVNASDYDWKWNVGQSSTQDNSPYATVSNEIADNKSKPEQDLTTKDKETEPNGEKVWAQTGQELGLTVKDDASLFITPQKPTVDEWWPKCHLACVNAEIGAEFSLPMDLASLTGVKLYKCGQGVLGVDIANCDNPLATYNLAPVPSDASNTKFVFNLPAGVNLVKDISYWVTVPSFVKSAGGSQMEKDFGWDFTTKNDDTLCDIDHVIIAPDKATVYAIGDKAPYYSQAFGTADECNKNGQKLISWEYNWKWSSAPDIVASITNWDKSVSNSKIGCNSLCQHIGSQPTPASGLCGDNNMDEGEDCDAPEKNEATCALNCLFKEKTNKGADQCSAQKSFNCCGNGAKEVGEDCDEGQENNGQLASGCSKSCLRLGTPISVNKCEGLDFTLGECLQKGAISVCGNSGNPEPGEDCDLGSDNGKDGKNCTANCLTVGKKMIENSLCGNGLVESGEDADCDTGGGDAKVDPLQWATAVGNGLVDAQKQMTAEIVAGTKNKAGTDKTGTAKFILQCGFSPVDANCPVGVMAAYFGIGKDSCCHARPTVSLIQPSTPPVPTNVCPNTAITLKFSEVMDVGTFSSSTILGYFNIILAEATSTPNCPSGTFKVAQETKESSSWWNKISVWFKNLIGQPAEADIYCAGGIDYTLISSIINDGTEAFPVKKTQVSLDLKKPLIGLANYKIIVTKDIKSAAGVSLLMPYGAGPQIPPYSVSFKTKDKLCQIDEIKIDPEAWWFNTTKDDITDNEPGKAEFDTKNDVDKMFSPHAYYTPKNSPPQELESVTGYSWMYNWTIGDNSIVQKGANLVKEAQEFKALGKNGVTQIGATAQISDGTQKSASSTVQVFICENPWPDAVFNTAHPEFGLGYVDAEGTDDKILNGSVLGGIRTNFKLMYCRDAGTPNVKSDDLPKLRLPAVVGQNTSGNFFKEFFFTFDPPLAGETIKEDKNSIGLRVYSNINHLPLSEWYQSDPAETPGAPVAKGAPTPTQVGSYKALQEGRTYYIDGLNSSEAAGQTTLYSNVYVFSFSDNPTAETLNIVNQLLSNLTLNVNVFDKEIVAKMYRDYQRLQDLKLISEKLWGYYIDTEKGNGAYPKLTENPQLGTYLPAYTNSKWKSWQGVLGNLVGYTLPIDPLNGFYGCASSTLNVGTPPVNLGPFDAETCWNAANSTFVCPKGSQVYQYETKGGSDATLKADFELPQPQYGWDKDLNSLKPDNSLSYQPANNCNDQIQGESGKCGDGIVGQSEDCEIGDVKSEDCGNISLYNGYPSKRNLYCNNSCKWEVVPVKHCSTESTGGSYFDLPICFSNKDCVNSGNHKYCGFSSADLSSYLSCLPQGKCGDGVKQGTEKCDDGKNNGKYGYCNLDCKGSGAAGFCGNGNLDVGKEVCDASVGNVVWCSENNITIGSGCIILSTGASICVGQGECVEEGAKYNKEKAQSCSWDCQSYDYCGDGKVNLQYEKCEKSEGCQVGTCDASSAITSGKFCEKDSDCVVLQDVQVPGAVAGTFIIVKQAQNPDAKCVDWKSGKRYCGVATEFIPIDATFHAPFYYKDSDKKFSGYSGNVYINCDWWGTDTFVQNRASQSVTCLPLEKPASTPSPSLCGNGKIEAGEVCDDGKNNGTACTPIANAKTCTYCEYGCQQVKTLSFP